MDSLDLEKIKMEAVAEIGAAQSENELVSVNKRYLDKDGTLGEFFKSLGSLSKEERGVAGVKANRIKQEILAVFEKKASELKEKNKNKRSDKDWLDVTLPGINPRVGHLHPLTLVERRIVEIFYGMGFEIIESQEIENEWYNFDALNIPKDASGARCV